MRLGDVLDMLGEPPTDERIVSGSPLYVRPDDRPTRSRIERLRKRGYKIVSLGANRFRCTADPISGTLRTDGKPFYSNRQTIKERYALSRKGFGFRKLRKGVYICSHRPAEPFFETPES